MTSIGKPGGGHSLGMAALLIFLALPLPAATLAPLLEAKVGIYQALCSSADPDQVRQAIHAASRLLQSRCGIRLRALALKSFPLKSPWCHLPIESNERSALLQKLAAETKAHHPRELSLFLVPSATDSRLSWAIVDQSIRSACDSPQEPRFLARFGSFFFTDLAWTLAKPNTDEPLQASYFVAHEVLHALTQRRHPTLAARGNIMADHVTDMGPSIDADWCDCARRSPYLRKP